MFVLRLNIVGFIFVLFRVECVKFALHKWLLNNDIEILQYLSEQRLYR